MRAAHHAESALAAEALATELDRTHPGAAASLREALAETLTVLRLGVPPTLARTLRSTNSIESIISIARAHSRNVKNWKTGAMALRWCAAGDGRGRQTVSDASTATCTYPPYATRSNGTSPPTMSVPAVRTNP